MRLLPALILCVSAIFSPINCTDGAVPESHPNHQSVQKSTKPPWMALHEQPKSRLPRAAPKYPGCVITINDAEAGALTSFLQGLMATFTHKPRPVTTPIDGHDNEIRYTCDNGVSNVKTSAWLILNRLWLATTCQYTNEAAFQEALHEVNVEKKRLSRILTNVDVRVPDGSILFDTYAATVVELETTIENTIDSMIQAYEGKQCNTVNTKQIADTLEAAVQEITAVRKLAEIQIQQREYTIPILANFVASQALAHNHSNTAPILEFILKLPKDLARSMYAHITPILLPSIISSLRSKDASLPPALTHFVTNPKISDYLPPDFIETVVLQAYDNNTANFEAVFQFIEKLPAPLQKSTSQLLPPSAIWPALIRNGSFESILSIANAPSSSVITSSEIQSIVQSAYGNNVKNMDSVLRFIEKLPRTLAVPALEGISSTLLPNWSMNIQNGTDTADVIRLAANPSTLPFLLSHIASLLPPATIDNQTNTVLDFIEALPDQTLANKAYETFFSNTVHPPEDPIRLLLHLNNNVVGRRTGGKSLFTNFLTSKVHPGYVKLVTQGFFNLETYAHRGEFWYIYKNPTTNTADWWSHGRGQKSDSEAARKQDRWLWQFLPVPVPGSLNSTWFYIRNKLNKDKPLAKNSHYSKHNYVLLEPVTPILLPNSSQSKNPNQIVIFMRAYNSDGFYSYWLAYDKIDGGRRPWLPDAQLYAAIDSGLDSKKWVLTFP